MFVLHREVEIVQAMNHSVVRPQERVLTMAEVFGEEEDEDAFDEEIVDLGPDPNAVLEKASRKK